MMDKPRLPPDVRQILTPPRWRSVLKLGPSRAQLHAAIAALAERRQRQAELVHEADARASELRRERGELRQQVDELSGLVNKRLTEPGRHEDCDKVRLHTEAEAQAWAAAIAQKLGEEDWVYEAYRCTKCSRHPATLERFWHVGHRNSDKAQQSKQSQLARFRSADRSAARNGARIGDRVDPTVLARLNRRDAQ